MKVLILNGSPRVNGNTSIALQEMDKLFANEGVETEIVQVGNKAMQLFQLLLCLRDGGYLHLPYPHGYVLFRQIACAVEYVLVVHPCKFLVLTAVGVLDVQQYGIGHLQQGVKAVYPGVLAREALCRCVETGVDAPLLGLGEQVDAEVYLQQCLSSAHGDATLCSPVGAIAFCLVQQIGGFLQVGFTALGPGVGVVAVGAAHGTSFEEDDEAHARTVNRAK